MKRIWGLTGAGLAIGCVVSMGCERSEPSTYEDDEISRAVPEVTPVTPQLPGMGARAEPEPGTGEGTVSDGVEEGGAQVGAARGEADAASAGASASESEGSQSSKGAGTAAAAGAATGAAAGLAGAGSPQGGSLEGGEDELSSATGEQEVMLEEELSAAGGEELGAQLSGKIYYGGPTLPEDARVVVLMMDESAAAPGEPVARTEVAVGDQEPPFAYSLSYPEGVDADPERYTVRVSIMDGSELLYSDAEELAPGRNVVLPVQVRGASE